ncbi:MAG: integration host factor subunit beta [Methylococcus sp.]
MTKSDLIQILSERYPHLPARDVELAVKGMVEHMTETLATGRRIEIRGFGSFSIRYRAPRLGRNPKTGAQVELVSKYVTHFKPGKDLRDKVNETVGKT